MGSEDDETNPCIYLLPGLDPKSIVCYDKPVSQPYRRMCSLANLKKEFVRQGRATPETVNDYVAAWLEEHGLETVRVANADSVIEWVVWYNPTQWETMK